MTKQVQQGIGRFADRLGKWARGDEAGQDRPTKDEPKGEEE